MRTEVGTSIPIRPECGLELQWHRERDIGVEKTGTDSQLSHKEYVANGYRNKSRQGNAGYTGNHLPDVTIE